MNPRKDKEMQTDERLRIEYLDLSKLIPAAYNPRLMSESEMAKLCQSLSHFGLVDPIVVRRADGTVIGGHQRLEAARRLGLEQVPVVFLDISAEQAKALNLALNKIQGEWDLPKLGELLAELERQQPLPPFEESFDAEQALAEAEQATSPTRVQPGEVWQLGKHRLACGDATDRSSWERLMAGKLAQAVVTDPPYAVHYVGGRAAQEERVAKARRGVDRPSDVYWDDLTPEAYRNLLLSSLSLAHSHSDQRAPLYLWFGTSHLRDVLRCLEEGSWQERSLIVWVKNISGGSLFAQYKYRYEACFYAHKRGQAPRWHGPTNETTVWEHDKPVRNELHPTMKPVPLIERAIGNSTRPRQLVLDPFLGVRDGHHRRPANRTGLPWDGAGCPLLRRDPAPVGGVHRGSGQAGSAMTMP